MGSKLEDNVQTQNLYYNNLINTLRLSIKALSPSNPIVPTLSEVINDWLQKFTALYSISYI